MSRAISEKKLIFPLQKSDKNYAHKIKLPMTPRKSGPTNKFSDPAMFFHQMNHRGTEPTHVSHETHPMSYLCLLFLYTGIFPKNSFYILFPTFSSKSINFLPVSLIFLLW